MAKIPEPANRPTGKPPGKKPSSARRSASPSALLATVANNRRYRRAFIFIGFALLLVHLLEFPHHTFDTTHDLSSHATFEYYAANNFQFGTEVYQNVGPYGYVHYGYSYIGYLHWKKVLLKTFSRLVLVFLIFWMMRGLNGPTLKFLWWAGFFAFFPFGDQTHDDYLGVDENYAYLTIYLAALWLFQDRRDRVFYGISAALWFFLAFMSLTKHTCFVLACSVVAVVIGQNVLRRNFIGAFVGGAGFAASLLIQWMLAGQQLGNLPTFVRGIFAFSGGYNEAMALNEPLKITLLGMSLLLLLGARIGLNWWREKREWGRATFEAFLLFVIWKHAFVRADTIHLMILFYAGLLFAIPFFYYRTNHRTQEPATPAGPIFQKVTLAWCLAVVVLCCLSTYVIVPDGKYNPQRLWNSLRHNMSWIVSPFRNTREMKAQLHDAKVAHALPLTKAAVGRARIDFFGYQPGYILLNDLNYWSRPMPITFAAANPLLQKANERFYRNPDTAPEFVLCGFGGPDDRLFLQDDALAFRALLDNYRPVLVEEELLLFQRRPPAELAAERREQFIGEQTITFDQSISFPNANGRMLWMEVKVEHNTAGKLMSFLYKTPLCYVGFQFPGKETLSFSRFVTAMGECGLILNPVIQSAFDVASVYDPEVQAEPFPPFVGMTFVRDQIDRKFFKDEIKIRFHLVDRPRP